MVDEVWGPPTVIRVDRELSELRLATTANEIKALKAWLEARDGVTLARLDAMDKAVALLEKFPTAIDIAVGNLEKLHDQRMVAIVAIITANKEESLNYRELIAEQTRKNSTDVDAAVKAAFAASTLAVTQQNIANALASDKQGAAFTKDIEKLTVSLAQIQKSSDDKLEEVRKTNDQRVNDLKERMGNMEARAGVLDPSTATMLASMNASIAILQTSQNRGDGGNQAKDDNAKWIAIIAAIVISIIAIVVPVIERAH